MGIPKLWDLIVIGGGTAGLLASRTAASFGASVLLIENGRLGGDCLWTGCVPSKALISSADAALSARTSAHLGVSASSVVVDFARVMEHVHSATNLIAPVDSPEALERDGVTVLLGTARFTGSGRIDVDGSELQFRQAFVGTGARPAPLQISGVSSGFSSGVDSDVEVLTSETFWDLTVLPPRLLVLGGGAIGCEIAQAMARLGSSVTLVQRGPRLLPKENAAAGALVHAALLADGVDVRVGCTAVSVESESSVLSFALNDGTAVVCDSVLAAIGRTANTAGLDLARVGVQCDAAGNIVVNSSLRTTNPRIWAAGDVTALPRFTHTAGVNASLAATNAILGLARTVDSAAVPRVTFTRPEVGAVGLQSADGPGERMLRLEHTHNDRAVAEAQTAGYTQLVVDRRGRVLGGTVVGPRAGESLGEIALAMRNGLSTSSIAATMHAYPTYSDALWGAAVTDVRHRLGRGVAARAIRLLRRVRARRIR